MKVNEAMQIVRLTGYIAEHDGTLDSSVIQDAVNMAVKALKAIGSIAGRLTEWEGIGTDGKPVAVLVRNDKTFNENMEAVLRRLANVEDLADNFNREANDGQI